MEDATCSFATNNSKRVVLSAFERDSQYLCSCFVHIFDWTYMYVYAQELDIFMLLNVLHSCEKRFVHFSHSIALEIFDIAHTMDAQFMNYTHCKIQKYIYVHA